MLSLLPINVDLIHPASLKGHQQPCFRYTLKTSREKKWKIEREREREKEWGTCWGRIGGKPKQEEMNAFPILPFSFQEPSLCLREFKFDPDKDAFLLLPDPITPCSLSHLPNFIPASISNQPQKSPSPFLVSSIFVKNRCSPFYVCIGNGEKEGINERKKRHPVAAAGGVVSPLGFDTLI